VWVNHNALPAVPLSAVIYALRAMVDKDIPLNQVRVCVLGVVISVDVGVDGWVGSWI
jgi:N-methylhydantoinase B/oxoprolinase/acetone carboxylase alpha subunit